MKYQFLNKIYDVIDKVCTFKFEKNEYFYRISIASMETGTNFLFFQSDVAAKRT